jgi:hypothetical protein
MNIKPELQKKSKQINICVSEAELQELKKISLKKNVSMSKIIRDLIFFVIVNDNSNQ